MDEARFRSGDITTAYIKDEFPDGFQGVPATDFQRTALICTAAYIHGVYKARAAEVPGRLTPPGAPRRDWVVILGDEYHPVHVERENGSVTIAINRGKPHSLVSGWVPGSPIVEGVLDGEPFAIKFANRTGGFELRHRGVNVTALVCTPTLADFHARLPEKEKPDLSKLISSPMPGLVVSVDVEAGQDVKEGEAVCVVEAMKMQNIIRAEADGTVKAVNVAGGDSVAADEVMIELA